ncbi:MAG: HD domain-containing protein [Desulfococcaceae bacterium]
MTLTAPPWNPDRYIAAARFAAEVHQGQTVPGTELPYLLHVATVCAEVMAAVSAEPEDDPDLAVQCALLHDAMEDAGVAHEALAERFGTPVADGVAALSKNPKIPKAERMAGSLARIQGRPFAVWKVKLADRITNLQPPPPGWSGRKIAAYAEEARRILQELGEASPFLSRRMEAKLAQYEKWIADAAPRRESGRRRS